MRTTVLIVGEGRETEPNYFYGLKREDRVVEGFSVTVKKSPGRSAEQTVQTAVHHMQRAENRGEDYDEVWCVLDVEGPSKRDSLDRAASIASENGVGLCLSNPCFEIWLLSHFERKGRAYKDCDAVIVRLNKHWREHHKQDYQKNDDRVYDRVSPWTQNAIENARWVRETHHRDKESTADCNSSTELYRLVRHLLGDPGPSVTRDR